MTEPMTVADIRATHHSDSVWKGETYAAARTILLILDWMSAREREAAELAELKRQIGEMGKRLQDDGR